MKELLLVAVVLAAGLFGWFLCRNLDGFMDKYRKARKKHREDNQPGHDV